MTEWKALVTRVEGLLGVDAVQWQELDPDNKLGLQNGSPDAQACMCWLLYHAVEMTMPFLKTVTGSTTASLWVRANSSQVIGNLKTLCNNVFRHVFDSIPPWFQLPFTLEACIAFTDGEIDMMRDIPKLEGHLQTLQGKARQIYISVHGADDVSAFKLPAEFFHLTNAISRLYEREQTVFPRPEQQRPEQPVPPRPVRAR